LTFKQRSRGRKRKNGIVTLAPALKEAITFNDLRAENATDEEDFEEAHNRLTHGDRETTQMVYVRKPRRARAGLCKMERLRFLARIDRFGS